MFRTTTALLFAATLGAPLVNAQFNIDVDGRQVQVHSFFSEGFVYTSGNNWLTMNTTDGSGFTDGGVNVSMQVTDKFRVGAQVYDRKFGALGNWHPSLDWAVGDYRFKSWFGIRAGKVKTTLGLFNDTQDVESLHTFALLPQSVYPADMRESTISHVGGDLYGSISLKRGGALSYTAYAGQRNDSKYGGYTYLLRGTPLGINFNTYGGLQHGEDLRWNTPLKGLLVGASRMDENITGTGKYKPLPFFGLGSGVLPYRESSTGKGDWTNQIYGEYSVGNLTLDGEVRRYRRDHEIINGTTRITDGVRGWYISGAYRISKQLELGTYYSRFSDVVHFSGEFPAPGSPAPGDNSTRAPSRHEYDKVVTARIDLTKFWNVKVEGHFMNGWGGSYYPDGFYTNDNPNGLKPRMNGLILRTGFSF